MRSAAFDKKPPERGILPFLALCLTTLALVSCAQATATKEFTKPKQYSQPKEFAEPKEYTLDNGLKVLIVEDHKAPLAVFQIWYKVGSIDETPGKTGLSHFLEHMMFKGTPNYASKEFTGIINRNGGVDNAFTTRNYTMYYQTLASDRINLSLELESDRMRNLLLAPADIESEKKVVMEERRLRYEDNPQTLLFEEVSEKAIDAHTYRNPVIGWMDDIKGLNREDLMRHYKTYYAPNNAVIIVAGDVRAGELIGRIRERFGGIASAVIDRPSPIAERMHKGRRSFTERRPQAELPFVVMAFNAPSLPDADACALSVMASLLSGKSGRLYLHIVRDKGLALEAFSFYDAFSRQPFLFYLGGTAKDEAGAVTLQEEFWRELDALKTNAPDEREVQKVKNRMEAEFVMGQDSIYFQGEMLGMFEMLGDWRLRDKYIEGIRAVRPDDVRRAAQKYFDGDNVTIGVLLPERGLK
jgi:zinc protease